MPFSWKSLVVAGLVLAAAGRQSAQAATTPDQIPLAPAFSGAELDAAPTGNWPTKALTREVITNMVTHGKGDMPPFGAEMSPDQMSDLAADVLSIAK
jgi:mono/diheme cytochrome c family protein